MTKLLKNFRDSESGAAMVEYAIALLVAAGYLLLAILTLGEGWHNNHHHYPASARQGFYWWEFDVSYYILKALSTVGLVWDLRPVPERALAARRIES